MLLFVAKYIEPYITIIKVHHIQSNTLWLKYTPDSGKKYVIGFFYNPPKDSPFALPDAYEELHKVMEYVCI